jgi:hypothetical protein
MHEVKAHSMLKQSYEQQLRKLAAERDSLASERAELLRKITRLASNAGEERERLERKYRDRIKELDEKAKKAEARQKRMMELEKVKRQAEETVRLLERDVQSIKTQKVTLMKQADRANKEFLGWRRERDKEVMQLRRQGVAKAAQLTRMEALHAKQQEVLRRKTQEAMAARKRLKELEDRRSRPVRLQEAGAEAPAEPAQPREPRSKLQRERVTPPPLEAEHSDVACIPNSTAPMLRDDRSRREWVDSELDSCNASHELQRVLEGEKALRTEAARRLREVERRLAALQNPDWWAGEIVGGGLDGNALQSKKAKLSAAVERHSKAIQEVQLQLVRERGAEEERGGGAADARRWVGVRTVAEARTMLRTVFRAASQQKAQVYETQAALTELSEEIELLRLKLEIAELGKLEASRAAAEAQAAMQAVGQMAEANNWQSSVAQAPGTPPPPPVQALDDVSCGGSIASLRCLSFVSEDTCGRRFIISLFSSSTPSPPKTACRRLTPVLPLSSKSSSLSPRMMTTATSLTTLAMRAPLNRRPATITTTMTRILMKAKQRRRTVTMTTQRTPGTPPKPHRTSKGLADAEPPQPSQKKPWCCTTSMHGSAPRGKKGCGE